MTDKRASTDEFFMQLAALIEQVQKKGHGSIFLTQKPVSVDSTSAQARAEALAELRSTTPSTILIRVSDGNTRSKDGVKNKNHVKLSTLVQPDDLDAFFVRYAETCKSGMQSLRKRDRSKRKKDKGKKKKTEVKT
ncbi:hypothetical protein AMS68_001520 [Peltaster fructicola]|uniref:Signal recognition particle subunit SRP14 n=1 Tax=Peltaster fructicola TaxID=286661 RepID=A0A6H0XMQ6_9PEZI|nr:hypothetical protein AMS68_001520 [Peltaster fructicola]